MRVEHDLRRRRRADARADRRRRPRPRVPDRPSSSRPRRCGCRSPTTSTGTRRCPRTCARRSRSSGGRRPATATSTATTSWSRACELGERRRRDPAAARLRRGPGRHLPRPRAAARPTTTSPCYRWLERALGRRRDRPPRQARHARVAAGQDARAQRRLRARRGARPTAARLPVRRQRPRRGRAGQAPRARRRSSTTSSRR